MANRLKIVRYNDTPVRYRPWTDDLSVLREVIERECYRRKRPPFDVCPDETWLDLGAGIGAFSVYCTMQGAQVIDCYEPLPDNFDLLCRNCPWSNCHQSAVTSFQDDVVPFYVSRRVANKAKSRGSVFEHYYHHRMPGEKRGTDKLLDVPNFYAGEFIGRTYDGVKIDIEGAEVEILEQWLLPTCDKLVVEYHTSRVADMSRLRTCLDNLKSHFEQVLYVAEMDRLIDKGGFQTTYYDRMIFCQRKRKP